MGSAWREKRRRWLRDGRSQIPVTGKAIAGCIAPNSAASSITSAEMSALKRRPSTCGTHVWVSTHEPFNKQTKTQHNIKASERGDNSNPPSIDLTRRVLAPLGTTPNRDVSFALYIFPLVATSARADAVGSTHLEKRDSKHVLLSPHAVCAASCLLDSDKPRPGRKSNSCLKPACHGQRQSCLQTAPAPPRLTTAIVL